MLGTGKTLIARQLAQSSHMDYAILSGGDVATLGAAAVDQLHGLFRWASRSRKGLLLFIDEAEAFLAARAGSGATQDTNIRNALNALLYQTGVQSTSFMMVLATNRPEDLDTAVLDRIDVSLHIDLPAAPERERMIELYRDLHVKRYLLRPYENWWSRRFSQKRVAALLADLDRAFDASTMARLTQESEGWSGRELSKLFISIHHSCLLAASSAGPGEAILTAELVDRVFAMKLGDHRHVASFSNTDGRGRDGQDSAALPLNGKRNGFKH